MATARARYEKGVLTPLEPPDLEAGAILEAINNHGASRGDVHVLRQRPLPLGGAW